MFQRTSLSEKMKHAITIITLNSFWHVISKHDNYNLMLIIINNIKVSEVIQEKKNDAYKAE